MKKHLALRNVRRLQSIRYEKDKLNGKKAEGYV